ncbi:PRA1 family protein F2-like [Prosopis cineraria]|uniref:PRA1 family protein F2-like n=1 Tax=Prosopis cineraria TaxID=364024 RepID=UPI00241033A7|nr:PRA1 family protein F2-like [Prosopis cineraria]
MTTYGTIPSSSSSEPSKRALVSRAKERIQKGLGTRRPWNEMFQFSDFRFPSSVFQSFQRINANSDLFRANYVIIILIILFLSLLWHPISLITLILMMAAWLFLYFLRDDPLMLFGYEIDERFVASSLLFVTIGMLFLTNVTNNVIVGFSVGLGFALVHAVMKDIKEGFSGNEEEEEEQLRVVSSSQALSS